MAQIDLYNKDCLPALKSMSDNAFDLAIVDPPYGIGFGQFNRTNKTQGGVRYKSNKYHNANWDNEIPIPEYFEELKRVSKNQIVWGGNYFPSLWVDGCKGFIFWYKQNPVKNFSDGELAFTSFNRNAKCFSFKYYGNLEGNKIASEKIHPTQKPVDLYRWLLKNYAEPGQTILDTHLGSGSIAIACYDMGFDLTAFEIDKEYFKKASERLKIHKSQLKLAI